VRLEKRQRKTSQQASKKSVKDRNLNVLGLGERKKSAGGGDWGGEEAPLYKRFKSKQKRTLKEFLLGTGAFISSGEDVIGSTRKSIRSCPTLRFKKKNNGIKKGENAPELWNPPPNRRWLI